MPKRSGIYSINTSNNFDVELIEVFNGVSKTIEMSGNQYMSYPKEYYFKATSKAANGGTFSMNISLYNNPFDTTFQTSIGDKTYYSKGLVRHKKYAESLYWHTGTVSKILHSEVYIGNMVQGKTKSHFYDGMPNEYVDREDWIVIENTHQPIIPKEVFYAVQEILQAEKEKFEATHKGSKSSEKSNIFKGLVVCGECGHKTKRMKCKDGRYRYTHPSRYEYSFTQDNTEHTIKNISTHNYTYAYDKANRLISSTESISGTGDTYSGYLEIVNNYTYDNNGNTLKKIIGGQVDESVVQYGYNELNQLTSYTAADGTVTGYGYDGTGMRVSKTQGDTTQKFYWDRGYIVNEATNGAITMSNHIGIDGIYGITFDGTTEYLLKNGHGDVVGTLGNRWHSFAYDYNEYGTRNASNEFGIKNDIEQINPFRYCGEYYDDESGLIYLRNRYYNPSMGRFITEDPVMDGNNWYAYCANNPVKYVDLSGLYYLEKDDNGQVYAVIELGDTLSDISYSEVADANAYLKLNYADPGNLEVGQRVNITGIYNDDYPIPTNIMLSKTSHTQGDSGLRDVSDEEVSKRARDKSLSGEERKRYQREEKLRGKRNKQKRQSHYGVQQSQLLYPNTAFVPAPNQSTSKVNMPDSQFWGNVGAGVITIVGVTAGIYYFFYTGDPSVIYQYAR